MSKAKENSQISSKLLSDVGSIVTADNDSLELLSVGTDGQVLTADSTQPKGIKWADPAASGLSAGQITDLTDGGASALHYHTADRDLANATGVAAIANGGTGASTAQAAIDNLTAAATANPGDVLTSDGTNASWVAPSGAGIGDVTGPVSSTNNVVAVFDGITGKVLKNSTVDVSTIVTAAGTQTLSNKTLGINCTWQGNTLGGIYGGTSQSSWTKGDILYASNTNALSRLAIGAVGNVLRVSSAGLPSWTSDTATDSTYHAITAGKASYAVEAGGFYCGGEGPGTDSTRWWAGAHNWTHFQATKYGAPTQVQIYSSVMSVVAYPYASNGLQAVYGTFNTAELFVGDYVGWDGGLYVVASIVSSTRITVTKAFVGGSPGFTVSSTNQKPLFKAYEIAEGTCSVSGTAVTYISGDMLPYGYTGDHQYVFINGTKYTVTQGPEVAGTNKLTLSTSAGTLASATFKYYRQYAPWSYVSLFRIQGIAGSRESNAVFSLNTRNELVIGPTGTDANMVGNMRIEAPRIRIGGYEKYPYNGTEDRYGIEVIAPSSNESFGAHYVSLGGYSGREACRVITWNSYTDHLTIYGSVFGTNPGPTIAAEGSSTDLDIVLTPKGAGKVRFGTWVSNADAAINGYIYIKDYAGNLRKVATIA